VPEEPSVARCAAAVLHARIADPTDRDAALRAAVAELELLPATEPAGGTLAADLVRMLIRLDPRTEVHLLRALDGLVTIADRHPPDDRDWPRIRATARLIALMRAAAESQIGDPDAAIEEADRIAAAFPGDDGIGTLHRMTTMALGLLAGVQRNDESIMRDLPGQLEGLRGLATGNPELTRMLDTVTGLSEAMAAHRRGDAAAAAEAFGRARQLAGPEGLHGGAALASLVETGLAGGTPELTPAQLRMLEDAAQHADATPADRALHRTALGVAGLRGGEETDPARVEAAIGHLRDVVAGTGTDDPQYPLHLASLALGLRHRAEITGFAEGAARAGLAEAAELLETARAAAGGPAHPNWTFINELLADVRRVGGDDPAAARRLALDGLRSYAWRVLLQRDPAAARIAARDAAADAVDLAAQCLTDHDPDDALRALDAGRGLLLFAATELRDSVTRLRDAGHDELAARWAAADHESPPAELRRAVVDALTADVELLDTPALSEIQHALRRLDADALVYLVPGARQWGGGWAVIAPASGAPSYMALMNMVVDDSTEVERYLTAVEAREIGAGAGRAPAQDLRESLDALCGWAWKAAIGPLIKPYLDGTGETGRVPRLVLVPMGNLARIPWQAAHDRDRGYAIHHVAISQVASARMLCAVAAAAPVPLTSCGLIVADPDTCGPAVELPAARLESLAIHRSFYRGARYVGRLPDGSVSRSGAGTAEDVRSWLRADPAEAGTMLHLAVHGVMRAGPGDASSHLVLAGGEQLTAEELAGVRRPIGLVVLAGCHTGRSVHGYDEAYHLGTMFLAAGARSVLSTQWGVPDDSTALLMYMFHHYLMAERLPARDALRAAQLWMIDGDREPPATMPGRLLQLLEDTDPADVVSWAAFVHSGQ
jgi:hypothetical protein